METLDYLRLLEEKTARGEAAHAPAKRDPMRPIYHMLPPSGWMNDPNGFSMYGGRYHLYYQYNPDEPRWAGICWGHMESDDLVFWRHRPVAIAPGEEYDRDGVFSGTALEFGGRFLAYYTGHRVLSGGETLQAQCLAEGLPERLVKAAGNPLVECAPGLSTNDFRDPKVWAEEGGLRMIVGGTDGRDSHLPLFLSEDGLRWEFRADIARGVNGSMGAMWECPDLFRMDGDAVLMGCPMSLRFPWPASRACYFIGELRHGGTRFVPRTRLQPFDWGESFYAPQTIADKDGRRIMVGWMSMPQPREGHWWSGCQSLPRLLQRKNGQIHSVPIPELQRLRLVTESGRAENAAFSGTLFPDADAYCEYDLEILLAPGAVAELALRELVLRFHREDEAFVIVTAVQRGRERHRRVSAPKGRLPLRLFVDGAVCECFLADGEACYSAFLWQGTEARVTMRTCSGKVSLTRAQVWRMQDIGL